MGAKQILAMPMPDGIGCGLYMIDLEGQIWGLTTEGWSQITMEVADDTEV